MNYYNVKLTKIRSSHENLRTDEIVGFCNELPILDLTFVMYGEGLELKEAVRIVTTTRVQHVETIGNIINFGTENSLYKLELLNDDDSTEKKKAIVI